MLLCLRFEIHMEPVVCFVILVYGVGRTGSDEQSKNYQKVPEESGETPQIRRLEWKLCAGHD